MNFVYIIFLVYKFDSIYSINPFSFLPSSSVLYPLDFQSSWQASKPIPITINYSVSKFGPNDELKERSHLPEE